MVYLTRMNMEALRLYQEDGRVDKACRLLRKCLALLLAGLEDAPLPEDHKNGGKCSVPLRINAVDLKQPQEHGDDDSSSSSVSYSLVAPPTTGFMLYKVYFVTNVDADLVDLESLHLFCAIVTYNLALLLHLEPRISSFSSSSFRFRKAIGLYHMSGKFVSNRQANPFSATPCRHRWHAWLSCAIWNNMGHASAMKSCDKSGIEIGDALIVQQAQQELASILECKRAWVAASARAFFQQSLVLAKVLHLVRHCCRHHRHG